MRDGWGRLSPRARRALFGSLLLLAVVGLTARYFVRSHDPRELYARALSPGELHEVSVKLDELEIDHQINPTKDNLLVAPEQVNAIKRQLKRAGVPHTRPEVNDDNPMGGMKTRAELEEMRHNRIAARLSEQIEAMEGVQSAMVNLAINEQLFQEEKPSTASVILTMRPGQILGSGLASSITRLVAGAVTGLEADQVSLVDTSGQPIKLRGENPAESLQQELQKNLDQYLEAKAQSLLDKLPGQAKVVVSAEFDLSQIEIKRTDVGLPGQGEVITVDNTRKEVYHNGATPPGVEVPAEQVGSEPSEGRSYEHIVEARRAEHDKTFTWTVHKLPRIKRIACSVLIDSPLRGSSAQIKELIGTAVGIDAERGDQLSLVSIPLSQPAPILRDEPSPPAPPAVSQVPTLLLASTGPLALIAGLAWFGNRRLQQLPVRTQMEGPASLTTVCDLNHPATGAVRETQVHSVNRLEQTARQNPQQLAELLKSTWLS